MSFILEAQRKDGTDDPHAAAREALAEHRRSRRLWLGLVVGGVALLGLGAFAYRSFGPSQASAPQAVPGISNPAATRELVVRPRERTGPNQAPAAREPASPSPSRRTGFTPANPTTAVRASEANPAPGAGRVLSPEQAAAMDIAMPESGPAAAAPAAAEQALVPGANEIAVGPGPAAQGSGASAAVSDPAPRAGNAGTVKVAELPPADRDAFPTLEFSTHIFADDPEMRAVVVNSQRLQEGQSIGEMVLRAVTEDGIIVDYRGHRVAVSVVEDWQ
jgi:hypothetical protein